MEKRILIILIIISINMTISCSDYNQLFLQHGDGDIPLWIHNLEVIGRSTNEFLVAYTSQEEIDIKENDANYSLSTYLITLFSIDGGITNTWDFYNYGMTEKALAAKVYTNEKLDLGKFYDFTFMTDFNKNGINEILLPVHAGGGQLHFKILEYSEKTDQLEELLDQKFDHFYDYALQTVEIQGEQHLKIFPDYGVDTREQIEDGVYKQEYLIYEWNESVGKYTVAEKGFEKTYEEDFH